MSTPIFENPESLDEEEKNIEQVAPQASLDDEPVSTMKTLVSGDGQKFKVSTNILSQSGLISVMLENDKDAEELEVLNVNGDILKKVIEYMTSHATPAPEIEKPLKSSNFSEVVGEADAKFIDVEQETLFNLILAANYMDIKPLLNLGSAKVASMIKGKSPEQIRETFNIENDFTPDEEAKIKEENKWAEN